jgi:cytosine/adenosine deaminase-related metal-dependent hydrolase
LRQGGRFGIGSDSNVCIGAAAELRQLEYAQRLKERARNVLAAPGGSSGRAMLDAASAGGSQALTRRSGRLATGEIADIVTLRADHPTLVGKTHDQILDAWVFSVGNDAVECVWSAGQKVVVDGRHVSRDPIGSKFRTTMRRLSEP